MSETVIEERKTQNETIRETQKTVQLKNREVREIPELQIQCQGEI